VAELLIELFSEEIPARMQDRAAADLKRLVEVTRFYHPEIISHSGWFFV